MGAADSAVCSAARTAEAVMRLVVEHHAIDESDVLDDSDLSDANPNVVIFNAALDVINLRGANLNGANLS